MSESSPLIEKNMRSYLTITVTYLLIITLQTTPLFAYGYNSEEDPLLKVFKDVVYYSKKGDWNKISEQIDTINDRVNDVNIIFNIDLAQEINEAINKQNFQTLIKHMAKLVFLAIGEKFYWNEMEKLQIHFKAKVRLRLAEEYYITLLAGNVRAYDLKNGTNLHDLIYQMFINTRKTIGSIGFFGMGAIKPDLEKFVKITDKIKKDLLTVFPYFKR